MLKINKSSSLIMFVGVIFIVGMVAEEDGALTKVASVDTEEVAQISEGAQNATAYAFGTSNAESGPAFGAPTMDTSPDTVQQNNNVEIEDYNPEPAQMQPQGFRESAPTARQAAPSLPAPDPSVRNNSPEGAYATSFDPRLN